MNKVIVILLILTNNQTFEPLAAIRLLAQKALWNRILRGTRVCVILLQWYALGHSTLLYFATLLPNAGGLQSASRFTEYNPRPTTIIYQVLSYFVDLR